jgi:hypothetical protein
LTPPCETTLEPPSAALFLPKKRKAFRRLRAFTKPRFFVSRCNKESGAMFAHVIAVPPPRWNAFDKQPVLGASMNRDGVA